MKELDATCSMGPWSIHCYMGLWSIHCSMGLWSIAAPVSSFCL